MILQNDMQRQNHRSPEKTNHGKYCLLLKAGGLLNQDWAQQFSTEIKYYTIQLDFQKEKKKIKYFKVTNILSPTDFDAKAGINSVF